MARGTRSIRLPEQLVQALDERAAALGVTRSQLIIQAIEQALETHSTWSPTFLKAIGTKSPKLEEAVGEMMEAIRDLRSRSAALELLPVTEEQRAELQRRLSEHERDPNAAKPWSEVRDELERE